jgi:hypothetical protein
MTDNQKPTQESLFDHEVGSLNVKKIPLRERLKTPTRIEHTADGTPVLPAEENDPVPTRAELDAATAPCPACNGTGMMETPNGGEVACVFC